MICCKACQGHNLLYRRPSAVLQFRARLDAAHPVLFHFCPPWSATAGSTLSHGAARRAAAAKPLLVGARDPAHCHAAWHRSSACPADSCAVRAKRHAGSGQPAATIGHGNTTSRRRQHEDACICVITMHGDARGRLGSLHHTPPRRARVHG